MIHAIHINDADGFGRGAKQRNFFEFPFGDEAKVRNDFQQHRCVIPTDVIGDVHLTGAIGDAFGIVYDNLDSSSFYETVRPPARCLVVHTVSFGFDPKHPGKQHQRTHCKG